MSRDIDRDGEVGGSEVEEGRLLHKGGVQTTRKAGELEGCRWSSSPVVEGTEGGGGRLGLEGGG